MQSAPSLGPRPLRPNSPPLPAIAITLIDIVARFLVALGSGGGGATSVGAAAAFPLASLSLVLVPIHRHRLGPPPCDVRNGARVPAPFLRVSRMWSGAAVVAGAGAAGRGSRHRCPFRDDNLWTEFSVGRFGAAVEGRGVLYDEDDAGYRRRHGLARNCQRRERKESRGRGSHAPLQAHVLPTGASFPVRSARARGCSSDAAIVSLGAVSLRGGRVCAWVTAVERSNGDIARCVLRNHATATAASPGGSGVTATLASTAPFVGSYTSPPVVQLRILLQNTGCSPRLLEGEI
uniref:Uncharacterized protein n=2 Tax=Odontella aurita TaxID=265563 RepID=A0A7S4IQW2_9STRA|mmetsp:Transcript_28904/g.85429  ORF Transcript_28904/g.85429 Transcript_28904/m.85429 type:complete len:291 (+) Transcript_28904:297-1169(+)